MTWTKKMVKSVTFFWGKNLSALKTAHEMNKLYADYLHESERFTRNSVIGKWNRLGLHKARFITERGVAPKPNPGFCYTRCPTTDARRSRVGRGIFKDIETTDYDLATDALSFDELGDRACRWPMTTGGFCGRPRAKRSYCQHHYDRAYQKTK
jgi:hypothetical protein